MLQSSPENKTSSDHTSTMEDKPQCPFGHSSNPFDDTAHNENQRLEELWNDLLAKLKAEGRDPRRPLDSLKEETEATNTASSEQEEHQDGSLPLDLPPRVWPSYDTVMSGILKADYNQTLTCPMDTIERPDGKTLSPHGVVCKARLELFAAPSSDLNYTGVLTPGSQWDHCLLRLSSAMLPPNQAVKGTFARSIMYTTGEKIRKAQLYPCSALKVFGDDTHHTAKSRNVLFGGSKLGQRETDFFAHCQCTSMTERMPAAVKPFVRKFWQYSKWPLSLGVSDFCKPFDSESNSTKGGDEPEPHNFPFALILKPRIQQQESTLEKGIDAADSSDDEADSNQEVSDKKSYSRKGSTNTSDSGGSSGRRRILSGWSFGSCADSASTSFGSSSVDSNTKESSFDAFLDFSVNNIPPETHLFDVYACPTPYDVADASKLQRIGKIVSTSTFMESTPNDGLFFKHQAKEEDYALRPDWPEALSQPVTLDQGKVKGTIGTLAGWKLFEQQIEKKEYMDFEQLG